MIAEHQTILWTIYGAGVLLFPVVTGFLGGKDLMNLDLFEGALPTLMLGFLWPVLLALCIIVLVMIVIGFVVGTIAMLPILLGVLIRYLVDLKTKKQRIAEALRDYDKLLNQKKK